MLRSVLLNFALTLTLTLTLLASGCTAEPDGPVVLAPVSLQESLTEVAAQWEAAGNAPVTLSFAGTPALARQLEAGAPAGVIISADDEWMDWLVQRRLVDPATRTVLASNTLVLVARLEPETQMVRSDNPVPPLRNAAGLVAMAEPDAVPAGRYAKQALVALGLWDALTPKIVPTENVRAALALVERGEAQLGIVYASDAAASNSVYVVAPFDRVLHSTIRYPAALVAASSSGAQDERAAAFLAFLAGDQGQAVFRYYGVAEPE